MPPRKGIFRRITEGIGKILGGGGEPPPREPPRPPPRSPPRPIPGPDTPPPETPDRVTEQFREVWNDNIERQALRKIQSHTGHSRNEIFQDSFDVFFPLVSEESQETRLEMYEYFIAAFYNDDPTYHKMDFFADYDIAPSSFAWEYWRESRGYGKK